MNEIQRVSSCQLCNTCGTVLNILESIAREEDALACILNAECAKVNKLVDNYSDVETLIAVDNSLQETLDRVTNLEGALLAKLNAILPLLEG